MTNSELRSTVERLFLEGHISQNEKFNFVFTIDQNNICLSEIRELKEKLTRSDKYHGYLKNAILKTNAQLQAALIEIKKENDDK